MKNHVISSWFSFWDLLKCWDLNLLYLQVMRQRQERSVQLALVNACAVPYALHPQAFHVRGDCDDVGAHVRCAAPVWKQSCNQSSSKSQKPQEEAKELSRHAGHALPAHSLKLQNTTFTRQSVKHLCVSNFTEAAHNCTLDPQIEHRNYILPHAKKDYFKSKTAVPPPSEAEDQAGFLLSALSPVNSTELTSSHRVWAISQESLGRK